MRKQKTTPKGQTERFEDCFAFQKLYMPFDLSSFGNASPSSSSRELIFLRFINLMLKEGHGAKK